MAIRAGRIRTTRCARQTANDSDVFFNPRRSTRERDGVAYAACVLGDEAFWRAALYYSRYQNSSVTTDDFDMRWRMPA